MEYHISVRTLQGKILTFTVDSYSISEGNFVEFTDKKYNIKKRFHSSNCEINEVRDFNG